MSADGLPFHLCSLDFDVSLENLDLLTSQQLALVQFHPDATDAALAKAEIIFWRRRQRDQFLLHVDALTDIGSLETEDPAQARGSIPQETSVNEDSTTIQAAPSHAAKELPRTEASDVGVDRAKGAQETSEQDSNAMHETTSASGPPTAEVYAAGPEPSTSTLDVTKSASPAIVVKEEPEDDVFPSESITVPVQQPSRKGKEREREVSREEGEASPEVEHLPCVQSKVPNGSAPAAQSQFATETRREAPRASTRRDSPRQRRSSQEKESRRQHTEDRTSKKRRRQGSRSTSKDRGRRSISRKDSKYRRNVSRNGRSYEKRRDRKRRRRSSTSSYSSYSSSFYSGSSSSYSDSSSSYSSSSRSRSRSRSNRRRSRQGDQSYRQRSRTGRTPARVPSPEGSPDRIEMARKYRGQVSQPEMLAPRGRSMSRPNGHVSPPRPIQNNYGFPGQPGAGPTGIGGHQYAQMSQQQYQQSVPAPLDEPKAPISIRGRSLPPQDMLPKRPDPPPGGSIYSSRPQPAKWSLPPKPGFTTSSSSLLTSNTGASLEQMGPGHVYRK